MAIMSAKPAWLRSVAAVVAWGAVTAVAATGSWLGMSTVLTGQPSPAAAASVVTPGTTATPSEATTPPRDRAEPPASGKDDDGEKPREEWNGWAAVGADAYERSFYTAGGSAVVRLLPGEAVFVSASPAEEYTVRKESPQPERLVITFHSTTSMVVIDCMWRDGEPYARVSET